MKKEAFEMLKEAETSWWYFGRARAIRAVLTRSSVNAVAGPILDFGAGFGGMFAELKRLGSEVYAYEPDAAARAEAATRGYIVTYATYEEALSRRYALVGLFDVVEHIEDDLSFLQSLHEALTPDGLLIITVPAFTFLWREHDVMNKHFRRYTRLSLTTLLQKTGYEPVGLSYWNMLLFFPAALVRLMGHSGSSSLADGFLNWIFTLVVTVEAFFIRLFSLPFGVSLVVVARKSNVTINKDNL